MLAEQVDDLVSVKTEKDLEELDEIIGIKTVKKVRIWYQNLVFENHIPVEVVDVVEETIGELGEVIKAEVVESLSTERAQRVELESEDLSEEL